GAQCEVGLRRWGDSRAARGRAPRPAGAGRIRARFGSAPPARAAVEAPRAGHERAHAAPAQLRRLQGNLAHVPRPRFDTASGIALLAVWQSDERFTWRLSLHSICT